MIMEYIINIKIDYIMISHFDEDHVGGLLQVLDEFTVEKIIINKQIENSENYNNFLKIIKEKQIIVKKIKKGDRVFIQKDLYIDIIWPSNNQILENPLNNNSIVCKLNYYNFSMLFTGDIEKIAEDKILEQINSDLLKSDVLKVAHHGSKTSSTEEFLKLVQPKMAVIGVGKNNKFGHPNSDVIKRLNKLRYKCIHE